MEELLRSYTLTRQVANVNELFEHHSPNITVKNWRLTAEWIDDLCGLIGSNVETKILSLMLLNDYLSRVKVPLNLLGVTGYTCVYLTMSLDEHPKPIRKLVTTFTKEDIQNTINEVLLQVDGKLYPPTVISTLTSIVFETGDDEYLEYASLISELLYIYFPQVISLNSYVLACGCLSLSKKLINNVSDESIRNVELESIILYQLKSLPSLPETIKKKVLATNLLDLVKKRSVYVIKLHLKPQISKAKRNKTGNKYTYIRPLGEGAYGKVGLYEKDGEFFARKTQKQNNVSYFELAVLSSYKHNNLIEMKNFSTEGNEITFYLAPGIPLSEFIPIKLNTSNNWRKVYLDCESIDSILSLEQKRKYQLDILLGLEYLHSHGIIHRDLKVQNIIIVDGVAKIADFGLVYMMCLSEKDGSIKNTDVYTVFNRPMELLYKPDESRRYTFEVDIWAMATVLLEIETGVAPFPWKVSKKLMLNNLNTDDAVIWNIVKLLGTPREWKYVTFSKDYPDFNKPGTGLSCIKNPTFRRLLLEMLDYNPEERPSISEAVKTFQNM